MPDYGATTQQRMLCHYAMPLLRALMLLHIRRQPQRVAAPLMLMALPPARYVDATLA